MLKYRVPLGLLDSIHESRYGVVTAYRGKLKQLYGVLPYFFLFFSVVHRYFNPMKILFPYSSFCFVGVAAPLVGSKKLHGPSLSSSLAEEVPRRRTGVGSGRRRRREYFA